MKNILPLLLVLALAPADAWSSPLAFSGRIQSEALAEEAIDLLHCLAAQMETNWELSESDKNENRLKLKEKNGKLEGSFFNKEGERKILLSEGEASAVCRDLAPSPSSSTEKPSPDWIAQAPTTAPKSKWIIGAFVGAALVGGFLLWRSKQPDHRALRMD